MGLELRRHGPGHRAHPAYVRHPFLSSSLSSERETSQGGTPSNSRTRSPSLLLAAPLHSTSTPKKHRPHLKNEDEGLSAEAQGEMKSSKCSYNGKRPLSRARIPFEAMEPHSFSHTHTHTHTWLPAVLLITFPIKERSAWGEGMVHSKTTASRNLRSPFCTR